MGKLKVWETTLSRLDGVHKDIAVLTMNSTQSIKLRVSRQWWETNSSTGVFESMITTWCLEGRLQTLVLKVLLIERVDPSNPIVYRRIQMVEGNCDGIWWESRPEGRLIALV